MLSTEITGKGPRLGSRVVILSSRVRVTICVRVIYLVATVDMAVVAVVVVVSGLIERLRGLLFCHQCELVANEDVFAALGDRGATSCEVTGGGIWLGM